MGTKPGKATSPRGANRATFRGAARALERAAENGTGPPAPARGAGRCGLAREVGLRRTEPEEGELTLDRAKIGELMMRLELAEHLIEKGGFADEWKRLTR